MHGSTTFVRLLFPVVAAACLEASVSSKLPSSGVAHSLEADKKPAVELARYLRHV
jgi:hypothetical protein